MNLDPEIKSLLEMAGDLRQARTEVDLLTKENEFLRNLVTRLTPEPPPTLLDFGPPPIPSDAPITWISTSGGKHIVKYPEIHPSCTCDVVPLPLPDHWAQVWNPDCPGHGQLSARIQGQIS